jgi:4-hydroxy-2-oxoheptanedioate aldolase
MNSDIDQVRDKGYLFKQELKKGVPKFGIFVNSCSPTAAEQLSHSGYDWLLVDMQHGPMNYVELGNMLRAISCGKALSIVRVAGSHDREGIQQALDLGANGILVPYVNTKKEAEDAISCCLYPTQGTRSVYFPQRSTNEFGLLGYVGNSNKNVIIAVQVETASCIDNIEEIVSLPGLDIAFLGQNDLCMSMGLYEKYKFPDMYYSTELKEATEKMIQSCKKNDKVCGVFLFGTDRVGEFLKLGFPFISVGNDLHHLLTQATTFVAKVEEVSKETSSPWTKKQ